MGNEQSAVTGSSVPVDQLTHFGADVYEDILLSRSDVFLYLPGPRPSADGYIADRWGLGSPAGLGYLHVTAVGDTVTLAFWQRPEQVEASTKLKATVMQGAGPPYTGSRQPLAWGHALLARAQVKVTGGTVSSTLDPVRDSSRYFVVPLVAKDGRTAPLGFGFEHREAAFSLKSALQDYAATYKRQAEVAVATGHGARAAQRSTEQAGAEIEQASIRDASGATPAAEASLPPSQFALGQHERLTLNLQIPAREAGQATTHAVASQPGHVRRGLLARPPPAPSVATVADTAKGQTAVVASQATVGAGAGVAVPAAEGSPVPGEAGQATAAAAVQPEETDDWGDFQ